MRRLCLAITLLLVGLAGVNAQDSKPESKLDPGIRLMRLYEQVGRSWSYRVIRWERGKSPRTETNSLHVSAVKDGRAQVNEETTAGDGNSFSSSSYGVRVDRRSGDDLAWADAALPVETLNMGFRKFRCRKHIRTEDGLQVTTWVSTEYHPLIVKQVTMRPGFSEIRKLEYFSTGDVDPNQLYRMVGRRWKIVSVMDMGGNRTETAMEYTVTQSDEDGATFTLAALDAKGKPTFTQDTEITFDSPSMADSGGLGGELKMAGRTCKAGEFQCYYSSTGGFESWSSVLWPGLTVATAMKGYTMELVEFDLGHDEQAFYRAKGNYYVTETTTSRDGKSEVTSARVEVTASGDRKATETMKMGELGEVVTTIELGEVPERLMPFDGQIEEVVTTSAGTFPAIRTTDKDGTITWRWNGIPIRVESKNGEATVITEVTELKLQ